MSATDVIAADITAIQSEVLSVGIVNLLRFLTETADRSRGSAIAVSTQYAQSISDQRPPFVLLWFPVVLVPGDGELLLGAVEAPPVCPCARPCAIWEVVSPFWTGTVPIRLAICPTVKPSVATMLRVGVEDFTIYEIPYSLPRYAHKGGPHRNPACRRNGSE